MSFLDKQAESPEYLNYYLKYIRYILLYSETTVNEIYADIRTFFRYLIVINNEKEYANLTKDNFKEIKIKEVSLEMLEAIKPYTINDYLYFLRYTLDNSAKTRNRKLSSLKNFFKYLADNNLISLILHNTQNMAM